MKPVTTWLRARGVKVVAYLDDFFICDDSRDGVVKGISMLREILEFLGFVVNELKSVEVPVQVLDFLGFSINSITMSLSLPSKKRLMIVNACERLLKAPKTTVRELASLLGLLSWASTAVEFAQSHYRHLQRQYNAGLGESGGNMSAGVFLSDDSKKDLVWWAGSLPFLGGRSLVEESPALVIFSDASLSGWGAACGDKTASGPWTSVQLKRHINELELLGAFYSLHCFAESLQGCSVLLKLDNTTAISYVNKLGGTKSPALCELALTISEWCESRRIRLKATHLPGIFNNVADQESRRKPDWSDWRLSPELFELILGRWEVRVDLFASSWNAQLPRFASWTPQPGGWRVNALSFSWENLNAYAFPPFSLIKNCLSKIVREMSSLVLVCPFWPSQTWFPLLLELACAVPMLFRQEPNQLLSCLGEPHPLCRTGALQLSAWMLSGRGSETREFRSSPQNSSWHQLALRVSPLTKGPGGLGVAGVYDSVTIPCLII